MKNITILAALLGLGCTSETMMIPEDIIGEAGAATEVPETGGTEATGGSGTGGNEPTGGNVETGGTDPTGGNKATGGNVATGGDQTGGTATGGDTTDPFAIFYESESNPNGVPNSCLVSYFPYNSENHLPDLSAGTAFKCWMGDAVVFKDYSSLYCDRGNYPEQEKLDDQGYTYFTIDGYAEELRCKYYETVGSDVEIKSWCCSNISNYLN